MQNSEKILNYARVSPIIHEIKRQKVEKSHPFAILRGKNKLSLI